MPFWSAYMLIAAGLSWYGWGRDSWAAPALVFTGLCCVRVVMYGFSPETHEVAVCTLWLLFAFALMYIGAWVPGFFITLSALMYPILLLAGHRIEHMGLMPWITDGFMIVALLAIWGGQVGLSDPDTGRSGLLGWLSTHSLGMAPR